MSQRGDISISRLIHKHKALNSDAHHLCKTQFSEVCVCKPSSEKEETGGALKQ